MLCTLNYISMFYSTIILSFRNMLSIIITI
jgi:hypothetical protein